MTDPTAEFFDELGRRGHEPLLEKATGTLRFDIADGKRVAPLARHHQEGRRHRVT
jgi:hypothetical protein